MKYLISLAPHYNSEEKIFMLSFYNNLVNCYDDRIIDLIGIERERLNSGSFSNDFRNEVDFIFYVVEMSAKEIYLLKQNGRDSVSKQKRLSGFGECITKKVTGKDLGRNMVYGLVAGGIAGAKGGATAGTFTVPGLGTAVGAVGGAVFGAAAGAVGGAIGGYVWPAIDCILYPKAYDEKKYLTNDFYATEMKELRITVERRTIL